MARLHIFADEAGCFTFNNSQNVSKYFILATITMGDCSVGEGLTELRRRLAWEGAELGEYFHATTDKQAVRDAVYAEILKHDFRVQATVMEKRKAQPHVRSTKARFYQYGWYYHFKFGAPPFVDDDKEALIVAATLGNRSEREGFEGAVKDVMRQSAKGREWRTNFCPAAADPCLQAADYCAWAIQRKWERGDTRSYDPLKERITYEYDLWQRGTTKYF